MRGVRLESVNLYADTRGELRAIEHGNPLDFLPARVFFIANCPAKAVRACHAVSSRLALVVLTGSVRVEVDNGPEIDTLALNDPDRVLLLAPGIWLRLSEFQPGTRIMVLASETFETVRYFDEPQPELMDLG